MPFSLETLDIMAGDILANLEYWTMYSESLFNFSDSLDHISNKEFWRILRDIDSQVDTLWIDYLTILSFVM